MSHMSRWARMAPLLLAIGALSPWCHAAQASCEPTTDPATTTRVAPINPKDFELGCGGKTLCLLEDSLQIKKISKTATLQTVKLCFSHGSDKPSEVSRDLHASEDLSTPLQLPLSGLLSNDLIKAGRTNAFWQQANQAATLNNKVTVTVILDITDTPAAPAATGASSPSKPEPARASLWQTITVDMTSLWKSGLIKPMISKAACPGDTCKFGEVLTLTIPALPAWLEATGTERKTIKLALNGNVLASLAPVINVDDPSTLAFKLDRGQRADKGFDPWEGLMATVGQKTETVKVVLANEQGQRLSEVLADKVKLEFISKEAGAVPFILLVLLMALVYALPFTRRLMRDAPPVPELADAHYTMAYSLGKSQMLFWTALVFVSWAYLWWATGDAWNFNDTALILMGISGATAVGAVASNPLPAGVQASVDQLSEVKKQIKALAAGDATLAELKIKEAKLVADIYDAVKSDRWLSDVTRNVGEDLGLHRAQSLLFTLAFGATFGWLVITSFTMPVFPATALALLGISGTAYVGFKFAGSK